MAYRYQYIPDAACGELPARAAAVCAGGAGHVHPLDRAAGAIAEAIAAFYRDVDDLRRTVPDLVSARADDRATEADRTA